MTFDPKFDAKFIKPIVDNLITAVTTNQTAALAWASPSPTLDDFANVWVSAPGRVPTNWPVLFLESAGSAIIQSDDDSHLTIGHELTFEMIVTGPDPETVTTRLFAYVRAVDAIWRTMASAELIAGMSASDAGAARVLSIDHEYAGRYSVDTQYARAAQLKVTVGLMER